MKSLGNYKNNVGSIGLMIGVKKFTPNKKITSEFNFSKSICKYVGE